MSYIPSPRKIILIQTWLGKESHFQRAFGDLQGKPADITDITVDLGPTFCFPAGESRPGWWQLDMKRPRVEDHRANSRSLPMTIWKDLLTQLGGRICCSHSKDPKPVNTGYEYASC